MDHLRELSVSLPQQAGAAALTAALREAVDQGQLCGGTPLPSTRSLASSLGVSRGVVVEAYERLVAEGRLVARRGSGTAVVANPEVAWVAAPPPPAPSRSQRPLRPGAPDLGLFPRRAWQRANDQVLAELADSDLDYPDPAGVPQLRSQLCSYLGRVRAARVEPASLTVTAGAAQAVSLLARALLARGITRIGVENPGPTEICRVVAACGMVPVPISVDHAGLDPLVLAERSRQDQGLRAVILTPAHQFPTGVVLTPERRLALIAWARRVDGYLLEDDYDAEFRYDREPVGCVQGQAPEVTALVGSVSKVLAPALRLGWICAPDSLLTQLVAARNATDLGCPALPQLALAELLASGGYDQHTRKARQTYLRRRDVVVEALGRYLPDVPITGVAAGLHLVIGLPPWVDDRSLAATAADRGLAPRALSELHTATAPADKGLVIGFGGLSANQLESAVAQLAGLVRDAVAGRPAAMVGDCG